MGGLQGIAMQPPRAQVIVCGDRWDPACGEVRHFLARNQIVHDWLSPETPDLTRSWAGTVPESTVCPVVRLADDTLIIGGGSAVGGRGVRASEGLRTLVIERERRPDGRPAPRHASRTTSDSRTVYPATTCPAARRGRHAGWALKSS